RAGPPHTYGRPRRVGRGRGSRRVGGGEAGRGTRDRHRRTDSGVLGLTLRVLEVAELDGHYRATLVQRDVPTPRSGEVLIRVAASGLNRADLSQIAGRYPPPSGESEVLGLEVSGWLADSKQSVCALLAGGGHAEYVAAPVGQVFPAPPTIDLVSAAGIPEAYLTAFVNLVVEAGLGSGDRVLVHAGASGVGLAAIQVAKLMGAQVAATTRTREKLNA